MTNAVRPEYPRNRELIEAVDAFADGLTAKQEETAPDV